MMMMMMTPYRVIFEDKKNTFQENLDQFLIKKLIERQRQPESAVDTDDPVIYVCVVGKEMS